MWLLRLPFLTLLIVVGLLAVSVRSRAQDAQAQPAAQSPESIPLTQMPPGPVIVSYQKGQLTIEALNATLSSVLRAACNQTCIALNLPSGADERVVGTFGPGSPGEVFADLLNGSHYNYLMVGSADDASSLVRLTLSPKPAGPLDSPTPRPAAQVVAKATQAVIAPPLPMQPAKQLSAPTVANQSEQPLPRPRRRRR